MINIISLTMSKMESYMPTSFMANNGRNFLKIPDQYPFKLALPLLLILLLSQQTFGEVDKDSRG